MSDDELDLVETGALINALFRRNASALVALRPMDNPETPDDGPESEPTVSYSGGLYAAIGLAQIADLTLKAKATA